MSITRRDFLQSSTLAYASTLFMSKWAFEAENSHSRSTMGVASASYAFRWRSADASENIPGFVDALQMLKHCESIGAAGVQVGTRSWTQDFAGKIRDYREQNDLYLEGSIRLPQSDLDKERFESEVSNSRESGAAILRTACLLGRRYEDFDSLESFEHFRKESMESVKRSLSVLKKYKMKIAIENHKDWRIPDLLGIIRHFDSEWVGINLDTGNNISFLEDPMEVVEALAPYTLTTHLKDMAIKEYEEGFLMSEVPLGGGFLDLQRMIDICRRHNPGVRFNLEMITRDPLNIPCLNENYWSTFEELPGKELAAALRRARKWGETAELPYITGQSDEERLIFEEENILDSFEFAKNKLGLI